MLQSKILTTSDIDMITIIKSAEIYKDLQVLKFKWFQDQPQIGEKMTEK